MSHKHGATRDMSMSQASAANTCAPASVYTMVQQACKRTHFASPSERERPSILYVPSIHWWRGSEAAWTALADRRLAACPIKSRRPVRRRWAVRATTPGAHAPGIPSPPPVSISTGSGYLSFLKITIVRRNRPLLELPSSEKIPGREMK